MLPAMKYENQDVDSRKTEGFALWMHEMHLKPKDTVRSMNNQEWRWQVMEFS